MKKILSLLVATLLSVAAFSQDFTYGDADGKALDMQKYEKDTSAHAVVLNEFGKAVITTTGDGDDVNLEYLYHVKIKFFDDKDFEQYGSFEIPLYSDNGQNYEKLLNIKAVTYYKDDNGQVQQAELDKNKIYREVQDKHRTNLKFAMPSLRKGCVIEVEYEVESPYYWRHFHPWQFQWHIPKMNSVYDAHVPAFWFYNASLRGSLKLTENKAEIEKECFSFHGAKADCSHLVYGMKDIPAFVPEEYMTASSNFMSSISFQLVEFTNLNTGAKEKYSKEWKDIDYDLKTSFWFGGQLKRKDLLKDHLGGDILRMTDTLERARAVYAYIQRNFKWNGANDYGSIDGIRKALDAHKGSAGDINLSLVTALNSANIPAQAVLLSTRENGSINKLYPSTDDFDYVIARTIIGGKTYLLDATDPLLSFGMLPLRCLNDQGRVFSMDKPSFWMDMNTLQREKTTYAIDLTLEDDGKLKGTIKRYSLGYSSYLKRSEIKKFNSLDEYVEHVGEEMPKTKLLKSEVINVDSLDAAIGETYDVEMNLFSNMNHDRLSFDPFLIGKIKTNPFKLADRDYPVDWGMPSDERYVITVHLPQQYTIENPPQALVFSLPNHGGRFITDFQNEGNTFTFSYVTQINNSVFGADEYSYLKELFNRIILAEKSELVLKKK